MCLCLLEKHLYRLCCRLSFPPGQVPGLRDRPFLCACCSYQTGLECRIRLLSPRHGQGTQGRAAWPRLHHLLLRNQVLQWDKPPYSLPSLNSFFSPLALHFSLGKWSESCTHVDAST